MKTLTAIVLTAGLVGCAKNIEVKEPEPPVLTSSFQEYTSWPETKGFKLQKRDKEYWVEINHQETLRTTLISETPYTECTDILTIKDAKDTKYAVKLSDKKCDGIVDSIEIPNLRTCTREKEFRERVCSEEEINAANKLLFQKKSELEFDRYVEQYLAGEIGTPDEKRPGKVKDILEGYTKKQN